MWILKNVLPPEVIIFHKDLKFVLSRLFAENLFILHYWRTFIRHSECGLIYGQSNIDIKYNEIIGLSYQILWTLCNSKPDN